MNIGIVGGGLMGLALAQRLTARGHAVHVFERAEQLGGLTTWHDFGRFVWDRFYHVILPSDGHLIRFLGEIGLGERLRWRTTLTGFYVDRSFHSLSTPVEFLRFPLLSLWSKLRLAATILYCSRIEDWRKLERIPVADWLIRTSGRATYEKMWKPLLLAKLGENYRRVSAVFIWSYIKRLFSARDATARKEQLGHVAGGYRSVFERLRDVVTAAGGRIDTGVDVCRIAAGRRGGIELECDRRVHCFDKLVFTSPVDVLRRIASDELARIDDSGVDVEYLGVICMALVTYEPLSPYYVLNIADERVPFTGVIGMSNAVATHETAGLYLTYLPKYVLSTDPLLQRPDEELEALFFEGLRVLYPSLAHSDIESVHLNRAFKVQPLQVIDYSRLVPQTETLHPDFYVLNTAQFVNNTLNNNEVVRAVDEFMSAHGTDFDVRPAMPLIAAAAAGGR